MTSDIALLNLVGVVQHAIGNLNLNDSPAALRTLMRGLDLYVKLFANPTHVAGTLAMMANWRLDGLERVSYRPILQR